jgi:hypothetical protein
VSSPSPSPARFRRGLAVAAAVIVVAVIALVVVLASGSSSPAPSKLPPAVHRDGPESILNASNLLYQDPTGTLNELQRLGVSRVQIYVVWANFAPDPQSTTRPAFDAADPAAYPAANWAALDRVIREAAARRMAVDFSFTPPPPHWASGRGAPDPATQPEWRPSAKEFGLFVRAVGTRYSGHYVPAGASSPLPRVGFWALWNEPNLGIMIAPQTSHHSKIEQSGWMYRSLVDAAWSGLQATGHGHDTVLIGEIAPAGRTFGNNVPGLFAAMAPLRFLRALYCVDSAYRPLRGQAAALRHCPVDAHRSARFAAEHPGLFKATAFSDHPYPQGLAPDKAIPDEPDFAVLAEVPKLERVLDTMQRVYGSTTRFPIYSTEFGYQTTPPDKEAGTVSPQTAARWLNWSEYLTWRDPRIRSYDQYLLNDGASGSFASGLRTVTGAPKPGFYAFRLPIFLPVTETDQGHPLEVWGCVRPVYYLRHRRLAPVLIQFRPQNGGAFRTLRSLPVTDRYGYIDVLQKFPSSGTVRLAWSYPHGPQIFSRTVNVQLH